MNEPWLNRLKKMIRGVENKEEEEDIEKEIEAKMWAAYGVSSEGVCVSVCVCV